MIRRVRSLVIMALLIGCTGMITAAGVAREATPSASDEPTSFVLVEIATAVTDVDVGEPGPGIGDFQVWGPNTLVDPDTAEDVGATTQGTCFAIEAGGPCLLSETIVFDDGSTLILQGVEAEGSNESTRTIVAGSGRFLGARGTMFVQPSEDLTTWTKTFDVWIG